MDIADAGPGPFRRAEHGAPTESDWIPIGGRRFKVVVLPSRLGTFAVEWCYGGFIMSFLGAALMARALSRSSSWAARIYWQRNRWYNGRYRWLGQEEFDTRAEAKARARQWAELLRGGVVPNGG